MAELPRVTYQNVGADFAPVHDALDRHLPAFRGGLGKAWSNRIAGGADDDGVRFTSASPIDERLAIGDFVAASPQAVDRAVGAALGAQHAWAALGWRGRVEAMRRFADVLEQRKLDFAAATLFEVGKSRLEAMGEAEEAIDLVRYYCAEIERHDGFVHAMARATQAEATQVMLRPLGVFGVIAPFNFPQALSVNMITGALLGGNSVVYKPSPKANLTGALLAAALEEALPQGVANLVCGEGAGRHLVEHPRVAGIAFTGSHAVGMEIHRKFAAGAHARPVIAEMGGKNPAYVAASADLEVAAEGVMRSAFSLQGQKCSACSVVYVDKKVAEKFIATLIAKTRTIKLGTPELRDVYMGPVINGEAGARFMESVVKAERDGHIVHGGRRLSGGLFDRGWYVEPTIVTHLPHDHLFNREELFLPFVSVQECASLGEGIARGNAVRYGLTAGVYAQDQAELDQFFATAEAGVLYANRRSGATTGAWPGIQSFCGWKGSGLTNKGGLGPFYLAQFMREQSWTIMAS